MFECVKLEVCSEYNSRNSFSDSNGFDGLYHCCTSYKTDTSLKALWVGIYFCNEGPPDPVLHKCLFEYLLTVEVYIPDFHHKTTTFDFLLHEVSPPNVLNCISFTSVDVDIL